MGLARSWLVTLTLAASLLLAPAASAGISQKRDKSKDVKAPGLTARERAALDIRSVRATGDPTAGLRVTVSFRGNVERALGRGRLRRGLVALVIRPRKGRGRPSVLATAGAGARLRTLERARSDDLAVVRKGKTISFTVGGAGFANVRSVEVKAFARSRASRVSASSLTLNPTDFRQVVNGDAADRAAVLASIRDLPCRSLLDLYEGLTGEREVLVERRSKVRTQRARDDLAGNIQSLQDFLSQLAELARKKCKIRIVASGYEHGQGFTFICGDVEAPGLGGFSLGAKARGTAPNGTTTEFFGGGAPLDSSGRGRGRVAVGQYGSYRLILEVSGGGSRSLVLPVEVVIDVPPPPPQATKDC